MADKDLMETAGLTLAHSALLTTLMATLQNRGIITQADVNEIIDCALVGMETAERENPPLFGSARRQLESFAETMGGKIGSS